MAGLRQRAARAFPLALLALSLLGVGPAPATEESAPLRVMALGDSLTVGTGSTHGDGYRSTFSYRMRKAGVDVDMVGGKADGPDTFDNRHQGYPHAALYDLSASLPEKVKAYQPQVVLLLTGSDEAQLDSFSPRAFATNLEVLIDRLFVAKHDAKLLISTLPPPRYPHQPGVKRVVNELLRRTVQKRAERGEAVYLVDSYKLLDPKHDMRDAIHPNDAGYERIGEAFANTLLPLVGVDRLE